VKLKATLALVRDLLDVLPSRTLPEWTEVESLEPGKPIVILVSGFGASRRNLAVFRRRFKKDGFNVLVLALDWRKLSDGLRGFYQLSESLAAVAISLRKRQPTRSLPVYIVAHSAGGLVARYFIQRLGGFHYCNALITLGTPHRGTWFAILGFVTHLAIKARCLVHMLPVSPFIRSINRTALPEDFPFLSISSPDDFMCRPSMARLPMVVRQSAGVVERQIPGISHSSFLHSKAVYEICAKMIQPIKVYPLSADKRTT
jgi:triacylglycerol lipase